MGKADLASGNRLSAFRYLLQLLAHGDQVGGGSARLVTVEANPVDRARVAPLVVLVASGKASRHTGSADEQEIHLMEHLLELFGSL
jgi:hypothetical protein